MLYCFNAMTGNTKAYNTLSEATRDIGVIRISREIKRAMDKNQALYNQYFFKWDKRPTLAEKTEVYKLYCVKVMGVTNAERWKPYRGVEVSDFGRVRKNGKLIVPSLSSNKRSMEFTLEGRRVSLARIVLELFVLGRELKEGESI